MYNTALVSKGKPKFYFKFILLHSIEVKCHNCCVSKFSGGFVYDCSMNKPVLIVKSVFSVGYLNVYSLENKEYILPAEETTQR